MRKLAGMRAGCLVIAIFVTVQTGVAAEPDGAAELPDPTLVVSFDETTAPAASAGGQAHAVSTAGQT